MSENECDPQIPPGWDPKTASQVTIDAAGIAEAIAEALANLDVNVDSTAIGEAVATAIKECFGGEDNTLDVEIDLEGLGDAVASAIAEAFGGEDGELDVQIDLGPLLEALQGCLTFGNCIDPETGEPVPVTVVFPESETPLDQCFLLPRIVDGCAFIDGKRCDITGRIVDTFTKVDGAVALIDSTKLVWHAPDGTVFEGAVEPGECPCVAQPACVSCWQRHVIEGAAVTDIAALLDVSATATISSFTLTVQSVGAVAPIITDCNGNETELLCGEIIRVTEAACADWSGPFQTITTTFGDRITIEAVTTDCNPSKDTP